MRYFFSLFSLLLLVTVVNAQSSPQQVCDGFVTRLAVGQIARVTPGLPNNLRAEPSAEAELITQIPEGGRVFVQEGPVCAEEITWWRVSYGAEFGGWTGEGTPERYWLEPLPADADQRVPESILIGLAAAVGEGGADPELCAPYLSANVPQEQIPTDIIAQSRVMSSVLTSHDNGAVIRVERLPINIESHSAWRMPGLCVPESVAVREVAAVSPDGETFEPANVLFDNGAQFHLPLAAYERGGRWTLRVNDWTLTIDIEIEGIGFIYDPDVNEVFITGFEPGERFLVIGGADGEASYFEAQADSNGSFITTYEDKAAILQAAALVGEEGSARAGGFRVGAADGVPDWTIPGEFVGERLYQVLWAGDTVNFRAWTCPGSAPIGLVNGARARVTQTQAVYPLPSSTAEPITTLETSAEITVVDGVVCADEAVWWAVDLGAEFGFRRGFLRESRGDQYWLEPAQPIDTAVSDLDIAVGRTRLNCIVTAFESTLLRTGPGLEYDLVRGGLDGGQSSRADRQALDSDGVIWWRLVDGTWIRSDLVSEAGDCELLPSLTP